MNRVPPTEPAVSPPALWFGVLGGAVAWLAHLIFAWALSEWHGLPGPPEFLFLGISGTAWVLLVFSVLTFGVACVASWAGYKNELKLRARSGEGVDQRNAVIYLARSGRIMSTLFAFIIVVQTIPILYFLDRFST